METNYIEDIMIVQDIDRYIVIDEESYRWILTNINCNYLMILFIMSCVCTLVCCYKTPKNDYVLLKDMKPVNGRIVEEAIDKV